MSKASKLRPCPALGRSITPADCGEQRNSRLACPADCPHNPLAPANYSQLLDIEERLDGTTMNRLATNSPDPLTLAEEVAKAKRNGVLGIHSFFAWNCFFAEASDKMTFARRWEKAGLAGLKNDERVVLRAKMGMRIALLEVHRVFDAERVEAVDLLAPAPAPMIFHDRSLAAMASRFSTLLGWVFPLPHYWRMSGGAVALLDVASFSAWEVVHEIVRHLGGPASEPEMRRWLAEHFIRFAAAISSVAQLRRQQMLAGMDAKWGKAVYELRIPYAPCRERLDALPEVTLDETSEAEKDEGFAEARHWTDTSTARAQRLAPGGQPTLGRVLLGQTFWRVEAFGAEKLARLRREFEEQCGDAVRFTGERVDDLDRSMASKLPRVDESLAPPRLLENPDRFVVASQRIPAIPSGLSKEALEDHMRRLDDKSFLEDSIPALDNHTPREAAQDPVLRPKLIQLMKGRVRSQDENNLRTGGTEDINWLLRELGLNEILFDPPPWRPPSPVDDGSDELPDPSDLADEFEIDPNRPPAPLLTEPPFEPAEAAKRLENAMIWFPEAIDAESELLASGATILDDAEDIMEDLVTANEFWRAIPFLFQAWFALIPRGCRAPEISYEALGESYDSGLRQLAAAAAAPTPRELEEFLQSGRQPGLTVVLLNEFLYAAKAMPKKERPSAEAQGAILALLKAVIEHLDEALRQP